MQAALAEGLARAFERGDATPARPLALGDGSVLRVRVEPLPAALAGEPLAAVVLDETPSSHGDPADVLAAVDIVMLVLDDALRLTRYTPRAARLFTLGPDDVGRTIDVLPGLRAAERLRALAARVLADGVPREEELAGVDDDAYLLRAHTPPAHGAGEAVVLTFVDITRRRKAEAAAAKNERAARRSERAARIRLRELEAVYRTAPVGLCVFDRDFRYVRLNERLAEINGRPVEDHIGRSVTEVVPGVVDQILPVLRRVVETGEPVRGLEVVGETPAAPGAVRTWLVSYFPLRDRDGTVFGVNTVAEEVTEHRRLTSTLETNEAVLRLALEAGDFGLWTADAATAETTFDATARRLYGLGTDVAAADILARFVDPDAAAAAQQVVEEALRPGGDDAFGLEVEVELPGGRRRWLDVRGRCFSRDDGAGVLRRLVLGIVQDVTARRLSEDALRELTETLEARVAERTRALRRTRDLFETLFHASPVPTLIVRRDDAAFVDANDAYLRFFGRRRETVVGEDADPAGLWPPPEALRRAGPEPPDGTHATETTLRLPSGEVRHIYASLARVAVDGEDHLLGAFVDVTARREAEEQVRDLAAALTLAEQRERHRIAQVLHDDLQQLLYGAEVQLHLIAEVDGAAAGEAGEARTRAEAIVRRAIQLTRTLTVDLSPPVLRGEGLNEAIRWLGYHMEDLHGLRVEIEEDRVVRIPREEMRVLLFQLVRELLFNVVKHAGVEAVRVVLHQDAERTTIHVEDRGAGFDPAARVDGGGGFGLFSVRERIRLFGGRFEMASEPGAGTRATITIPTHPAARTDETP